MPLVAWLLLAFAMALAGTWLARAYAVRHALLDLPDAAGEGAPRRSHALPTPRGGGIAIVLAVLPVLAWLAWMAPGQRNA